MKIRKTLTLPLTHQELLSFAVRQTVHSEWHGRRDAFVLRLWAADYARQHGLVAPVEDDDYGIYYPFDEDELAELQAEAH